MDIATPHYGRRKFSLMPATSITNDNHVDDFWTDHLDDLLPIYRYSFHILKTASVLTDQYSEFIPPELSFMIFLCTF